MTGNWAIVFPGSRGTLQDKRYLYFISKESKRHDHVPRLVYLLQHPHCLGEEGGRVRSSILWDCSTEILLITAKDRNKIVFTYELHTQQCPTVFLLQRI